MQVECTSNIQQLRQNLQKRKKPGGAEFIISCENRMPYAVAVDQGYTQKVSRQQQIAIILALKKRKNPKPPVWEGKDGYEKVVHDDGTYTITIPPAGIMAKSVQPIRELVTGIVSRQGLTDAAAWDIARGMEAILGDNSPTNDGLLRGAWKGVVR